MKKPSPKPHRKAEPEPENTPIHLSDKCEPNIGDLAKHVLERIKEICDNPAKHAEYFRGRSPRMGVPIRYATADRTCAAGGLNAYSTTLVMEAINMLVADGRLEHKAIGGEEVLIPIAQHPPAPGTVDSPPPALRKPAGADWQQDIGSSIATLDDATRQCLKDLHDRLRPDREPDEQWILDLRANSPTNSRAEETSNASLHIQTWCRLHWPPMLTPGIDAATPIVTAWMYNEFPADLPSAIATLEAATKELDMVIQARWQLQNGTTPIATDPHQHVAAAPTPTAQPPGPPLKAPAGCHSAPMDLQWIYERRHRLPELQRYPRDTKDAVGKKLSRKSVEGIIPLGNGKRKYWLSHEVYQVLTHSDVR